MNESIRDRDKYQKMGFETHFASLSNDLSRKLVKNKSYKLLAIDARQVIIQIKNELFFIEIENKQAKITTKILFQNIKQRETMKSCFTYKQYLFVYIEEST
jgi:hypothetical protein